MEYRAKHIRNQAVGTLDVREVAFGWSWVWKADDPTVSGPIMEAGPTDKYRTQAEAETAAFKNFSAFCPRFPEKLNGEVG